MPKTFSWGSSGSSPSKTTGFTGSGTYTNTATASALSDRDGNFPIRVVSGRMYLGGQGASRTVSIKVGTRTTSNFTVTNVGTNTTEPKAYDVGFNNLTTAHTATGASSSVSVSVGFATNGLTYFGRWGTNADTTTLWGQCEYYTIGSPGTPTASNITSSSMTLNNSPADDGGYGSITGYIQLFNNSAFTGTPLFDVASGTTVTGLSASTTYYMRAYSINTLGTSRYTTGSYPATTSTPTIPTAPTSLTATTNRIDGTLLSWSGATGSIDSYGIWWGGQPSDSSTPDFTRPSTESSFLDTTLAEGNGRYYWIRSQNNTTGNSPWYPASSTGVYGFRVGSTVYTVTFDPQGGTFFDGGTSNKSVTQASFGAQITAPTISRSGYIWGGWWDATSGGNQIIAANGGTLTPTSSFTLYARWTQSLPVFSDQSITTTAILNKNINTNADYTVTASPVQNYFVEYAGSGLNPTSWLTINSSGQLSGVPPALGTYSFRVRANNGGTNDAYSNTFSITVSPPGERMTGTSTTTPLTVAKRFVGAAGAITTNAQGANITADSDGYVNITMMKRLNSSGIWEHITGP